MRLCEAALPSTLKQKSLKSPATLKKLAYQKSLGRGHGDSQSHKAERGARKETSG